MSVANPDEAWIGRNLRVARALAAAGCPVFPCDPQTEEPRVDCAACSTTDGPAVEALWQRHPGSLPAIDLAKAGLLVFELFEDGTMAGDGIASFGTITRAYAWDLVSPSVSAPDSGVQVYFRQPEGEPFGESVGVLRPYGINIRGQGGHVIAAGARRADGERWADIGHASLLRALLHRTVPVTPPWLAALIRRAQNRAQSLAGGPASGSARPLADLLDRPLVPARSEDAGDRESETAEKPGAALWRHPDLSYLGSGRTAPPAFPLETLGEGWGSWCAQHAQARGVPVDYVACTLISAVAAMVGNRRWPHASGEWREPPVLWVALVGAPSAGKTPAQEPVLESVRAFERACQKRLLISDATPAAIAALIHKEPGGLLLHRHELGGWLRQFDRHGGDGGRRELWLAAYDGRRHAIDRCKDAGSVDIPHLTIGILGAITPEKVAPLARGAPDGVCPRFLWCWPEPAAGGTLRRTRIDPARLLIALHRIHGVEMAKRADGSPAPGHTELSEFAAAAFGAFVGAMKERALASFGGLGELLGKAPGHCLRLALTLRFLDWTHDAPEDAPPPPSAIEREHVERAAHLVESYFLPMARRTFGEAVIPPHELRAMTLARWLCERRATGFNARAARREVAGPLREPAHMEAACATLVEAGLIRPRLRDGSRGRPPGDFEVNPAVRKQAGGADSGSACQKCQN